MIVSSNRYILIEKVLYFRFKVSIVVINDIGVNFCSISESKIAVSIIGHFLSYSYIIYLAFLDRLFLFRKFFLVRMPVFL